MSIYNMPLDGVQAGDELDALFPLGQIVVVKEPTYKCAAQGTGNLIRVDSPTDVFFPTSTHELVLTTRWKTTSPARRSTRRDFKAEGNSYFSKKQYRLAEKSYTEGIDAASQDALLLYLNRANTSLHLGHPRAAHRDALKVLSMLEEDEKLGCAASRKRRYIVGHERRR